MSKMILHPDDYIAVHRYPVWYDQSNFLIHAYIEGDAERNRWEQLWVKQVDDKTFVICCIPFFTYDLALGDLVSTDEDLVIQNTLQASGQFTFRIWFGDAPRPEIKDEVLQELEARNVLFEWSSIDMLAVSGKDFKQADEVANYLHALQVSGELIYENGFS